jgi:hypothetical protein
VTEQTYSESARGVIISRARARQEVAKHGLAGEWDKFLAEVGDSETYDAGDVMDWLGY